MVLLKFAINLAVFGIRTSRVLAKVGKLGTELFND